MASVLHKKVLETKLTPLPSIQRCLDAHGLTLSKAYAHPDIQASHEPGKAQPYVVRLKRLSIMKEEKLYGAIFKCERHGDFTNGFWVKISKSNFVSAHLCTNTLTDNPIVFHSWKTIEDGWLLFDPTVLPPVARTTLHVIVNSPLMIPKYAVQQDYLVLEDVRKDIDKVARTHLPHHRVIVGPARSGKTWKVQQLILQQRPGPIAIITADNPWANPGVNITSRVQDLHFYPTWSAYWKETGSPRESIVVIDEISHLSKDELAQVTTLVASQKTMQLWLVAQNLKQVPHTIRPNTTKIACGSNQLWTEEVLY